MSKLPWTPPLSGADPFKTSITPPRLRLIGLSASSPEGQFFLAKHHKAIQHAYFTALQQRALGVAPRIDMSRPLPNKEGAVHVTVMGQEVILAVEVTPRLRPRPEVPVEEPTVSGGGVLIHIGGPEENNRYLLKPRIAGDGSVTWSAKKYEGEAVYGENYGSYGWSDGKGKEVSWIHRYGENTGLGNAAVFSKGVKLWEAPSFQWEVWCATCVGAWAVFFHGNRAASFFSVSAVRVGAEDGAIVDLHAYMHPDGLTNNSNLYNYSINPKGDKVFIFMGASYALFSLSLEDGQPVVSREDFEHPDTGLYEQSEQADDAMVFNEEGSGTLTYSAHSVNRGEFVVYAYWNNNDEYSLVRWSEHAQSDIEVSVPWTVTKIQETPTIWDHDYGSGSADVSKITRISLKFDWGEFLMVDVSQSFVVETTATYQVQPAFNRRVYWFPQVRTAISSGTGKSYFSRFADRFIEGFYIPLAEPPPPHYTEYWVYWKDKLLGNGMADQVGYFGWTYSDPTFNQAASTGELPDTSDGPGAGFPSEFRNQYNQGPWDGTAHTINGVAYIFSQRINDRPGLPDEGFNAIAGEQTLADLLPDEDYQAILSPIVPYSGK